MRQKLKAWSAALVPLRAEFARSRPGRYLARFSPGFFAWTGATFLGTFLVIILIAKIFFAGSTLSSQAIETGQRVLIHVASGDVDGNAMHTKPEPPAPATASHDAPVLSAEGLAPAPLEALTAETDKGLVPMVGADGTLPWKYYARPYKPKQARPIVAVVITQLGLSQPRTEDALKLPHDFTLSFSPYASDARKWAAAAREAGFETLVDIPMQTADYRVTGADPGPYGLFEDLPSSDASLRLRWVLSRFAGFVGVLAPENETLTARPVTLRPTLTELAGHGVLFFYIRTAKNTEFADQNKAHAIGIDKVIDDDIELGPIEKQLDDLTALAKTQGYAIGFAHAYPPTLEALSQWADGLNTQGVDLVPVSAIGMKLLP